MPTSLMYHVIGLSDLVDLWVIKTQKLLILCARATSSSRKVWSFCSQNNKIVLSNMAGTSFRKITRCAKVCGLFFLDCAVWVLIGWAGKL